MCTISYKYVDISVELTIQEARRIGDLNIDLDEIEIIRWRRKVRDAVRDYDKRDAVNQSSMDIYSRPRDA